MTEPRSIVFIVNYNASARGVLKRLVRSVGHDVVAFGSAEEFVQKRRRDVPGCLILDVRLPGISGLELQRNLIDANTLIPIIFVTAHGDIPMSVQAMKAGAVDFLTKPFRDQDLLDAIHIALQQDHDRLNAEVDLAVLRKHAAFLTAREREVIAMVVAGMLNKQIAAQLGITENTVKVHRSRAMGKMRAQSLAELVRMLDKLDVSTDKAT
jgi:RNA polymerase sigma factor (sigma-70 family)